MRMAVDCIRKNSGVTRQFLGDRIKGVFIDINVHRRPDKINNL